MARPKSTKPKPVHTLTLPVSNEINALMVYVQRKLKEKHGRHISKAAILEHLMEEKYGHLMEKANG